MQNPYVFDVGDAEALEGRAASVFDIAAAEAEEELEAVVSKVLEGAFRRAARKRRLLRKRRLVRIERKMKVPNAFAKRKAFAKMDSWEQRRLISDRVMARWELRCMESSQPPAPEWTAAAVVSSL